MADQADCVLVFGASLNFLTTSFGTSLPQVPLIQVDALRTNIGRWFTADVGVVGDARLVAEQLFDTLPERSAGAKPFHGEATRKLISAFDRRGTFKLQIQPARLIRALSLSSSRNYYRKTATSWWTAAISSGSCLT